MFIKTIRNVISYRRNSTPTSGVELLPRDQRDTISSEHKGPTSMFNHSCSFPCGLSILEIKNDLIMFLRYLLVPSHLQTAAQRKLHIYSQETSKTYKDKKCVLNQIENINSFSQRYMKRIALIFCYKTHPI